MALQGKLIEYVEHGKFICAMVIEESGKKLRLLNQNGRDVSLSLARVVHQSTKPHDLNASRDEQVKELLSVAEKRKKIKEAIDLQEIWELASEENESSFSPRFLAELSLGEKATDNHEAAFLRRIFEDPLYFKYREGKVLVHPAEVVEQQQIRLKKEREKQAFKDNSANGLAEIMAGNVSVDWPERNQCLQMLAEYYLKGNDAEESTLARELLKSARLTRPHDVYHLLIKAGVWEKNENIPLLRYELPVEFDEDALEQAARFKEPDVEELLAEGRHDLRDLPLLTIDGAATRDFDDALHVEKQGDEYLVGIHITDVTWYIKPDTPLFEEARRRTTSVYFAEGQVPMLPKSVSESLCSLIAGKDRAALSYMVRLSADCEVLDVDIVPSIVRVKQQLIYQEAEELLESDEQLKILYQLSQTLMKSRIEQGAILIPIPDINITIGSDENIEIELADVDTPTRTLVAEFMVLANTLGARYVSDQQVPGLFRSQGKPSKKLIEGYDKDLYINFKQRRHLSPAQLLTSPKAHSCVGVPQYTTVTSPIRRFLDLVMQHQIISLVQRKGARFLESELKNFIPGMIANQTKVNLVKRLRHRYWILKYLEKRKGEELDALLLEKGPRRVSVVLLDVLIEGDLPPNQAITARPGDRVPVKIAKVSPLDDILRLEW